MYYGGGGWLLGRDAGPRMLCSALWAFKPSTTSVPKPPPRADWACIYASRGLVFHTQTTPVANTFSCIFARHGLSLRLQLLVKP